MVLVIGYLVVDHLRRPADVRPKVDDHRFKGLQEQIATSNPWRAIPGVQDVQLTSFQITLAQYANYMHAIRDTIGLAGQPDIDMMVPADRLPSANKPIGNITAEQARGFCEAIGGTLPSEAVWRAAARAHGDIENADGSVGPSREWVAGLRPTQCGNDRNDDPNDRSKYEPVCGPGEPASRLGFRCAK